MPSPQIGPHSRAWNQRARTRIPGGVNSPVRAWKRLGGEPPVMARGAGSALWDVDGRRYIDYVLSWGPLILGHAYPAVIEAITRAAEQGTSFGAPTVGEVELAELLCSALPGLEQVRLVNSGTEATMSAIRLARAATGRSLIIKCDGCYHGHADHLLVAAGSGLATQGTPDSAGVPKALAGCTLVLPYNDRSAWAEAFSAHGADIAGVIIEPVAGNMGLVLPDPAWLADVRALCTRYASVLIFDEVMTGFRCAWGGYQVLAKIQPDLTCLGKVIGGGLPLAAYGGRADLMAHLAPLGACYQAGTLSGNPVAVAAGLATLRALGGQAFYQREAPRLARLVSGIQAAADDAGLPFCTAQVGTMWGFFTHPGPVRNYAQAQKADAQAWARWATSMLDQGIHLACSPFEAAFWSSAHSEADIDTTIAAAQQAAASASLS